MKKKLLTLCLAAPLICFVATQFSNVECQVNTTYLAKCPCKNKPKNESPTKKDKEKNEKKAQFHTV
jgi:hypothetical protein